LSALAHLAVLAVLFVVLRGRLVWTRIGGLVLAAGAMAGLVSSWSDPTLRRRLSDPDLWPAQVFVVLAVFLAWWTTRREQRQTTPA